MLKHMFIKDDIPYSFKKIKISVMSRAPQENDAKFRFPLHLQRIRQFHDNSKIAYSYLVWHTYMYARLLPHGASLGYTPQPPSFLPSLARLPTFSEI